MTLEENTQFFTDINNLRQVLLNLSRDGLVVRQFRSKDGNPVIEIKPDPRLLATGESEGWQWYEDSGVKVIWRTTEDR